MSTEQHQPEETVYQYIRRQIMERQLFPGSRITEEQVAHDTGVSRTPIRAALKRLSYEGLVTLLPYKGAFVARPTFEEMREAYECKLLLEAEAARRACGNIGETQLRRLEALLAEERRTHDEQDLAGFIRINTEFHMILAVASGNRYFEKYISELVAKCDVYLIFYDKFVMTPAEDSAALAEHHAIIEALRNGDAEGCALAMARHNRVTLDELKLNLGST